MRLRHGGLGAVPHVVEELPTKRQLDVLAVEIACSLAVYQEKVVAAWAGRQINVLADLDETVCPEDRQPPVAPAVESIGGEPIDADISSAAVAMQQHVA